MSAPWAGSRGATTTRGQHVRRLRTTAGALRVALSALVVLGGLAAPVYGSLALSSVAAAEVGAADETELAVTVTSSTANPDTLVDTIPPAVAKAYRPPVRATKAGIALRVNSEAEPGGGAEPGARNAVTGQVMWREGACEHVTLTFGRCPTGAGEVMAETSVAQDMGWRAGETLSVVELTGISIFDVNLTELTLTLVGGYTQRDDEEYWQGSSLPTALDSRTTNRLIGTLFTDRSTLTQTGVRSADGTTSGWQRLEHRVDLAYPPSRTELADVAQTGDAVRAYRDDPAALVAGQVVGSSDGWLSVRSGLPELVDEVQTGGRLALVTLSLFGGALTGLTAYVLWLALRAAVAARRPDAAVARLRGQGPRGVLSLLLRGLLPTTLAGIPVGLLTAAGLAAAAARWLFDPSPALTLDATILAVAGAVALVPPLLTVAAAWGMSRTPLPSLLRSVPERSGRLVVSATETVIATVAIAGLVAVLSGSLVGPMAMSTPILLAAVVGLVAGRVTTTAFTRAGPALLARGRTAWGLALTRAGRRGTGRLIVPVIATAGALLVFATTAFVTADAAYARQSLHDIGAPARIDLAPVRPDALTAALDTIDPTGRKVAAAYLVEPADPTSTDTLAVDVDAIRGLPVGLEAVADSTWEQLRPSPVPPLTFAGRELTLTLRTPGLVPSIEDGPAVVSLTLDYLNADLAPLSAPLSTLGTAPLDDTVALTLPCEDGCRIIGIGTDAGLEVPGPTGTFSVGDARLDGQPLDLGGGAAWPSVPARPDTAQFTTTVAPDGSTITIDADFSSTATGVVAHASAPRVIPGLATSAAARQIPLVAPVLSGGVRPMNAVATTPAIPLGGPSTVLVDLTSVTGAGWFARSSTPHVLLTSDDPALVRTVQDGLRNAGITVIGVAYVTDRATEYARSATGWSLRLAAGLAVAALVVAAAALSAVVSAAAPVARSELAAVRLLGGNRPLAFRVIARELVPVVAVGLLAGAASGILASRLSLPSLPLYVHPPDVVVATSAPVWAAGLGATAAAAAVLGAVALLLSRWLARSSSPATLETRR
ncbi:MAG: hypothetical protein KBB39_03855 [Phycicoccus sp.]|nr:hypothetical protein [Phycicoccus sp.]